MADVETSPGNEVSSSRLGGPRARLWTLALGPWASGEDVIGGFQSLNTGRLDFQGREKNSKAFHGQYFEVVEALELLVGFEVVAFQVRL